MSLANYKMDKDREVNGVTVDFGINEDGTKQQFVVARASKTNKAYQKALTQAAAPFQRRLQLKVDVSEELDAAFKKVFAQTILKGWSNIPAEFVSGNSSDAGYAPFSEENALKLFELLPDVYDYLNDESNNMALFREEEKEESAKN